MNKQIKELADYVSTMATLRHYNGVDKVMVETMLEMADLISQFAEAKNKQAQLEYNQTALEMLLEKAIDRSDYQARKEMQKMSAMYIEKTFFTKK